MKSFLPGLFFSFMVFGSIAYGFVPTKYSCVIPPQGEQKLALKIDKSRIGIIASVIDLGRGQEVRSLQVLLKEVPGGTLVYEGFETIGTYGATRKGLSFAVPLSELTRPGKALAVLSLSPTNRYPEIGPVFLNCNVQ